MLESDCNLAIALNRSYTKAYARRGAARFALQKLEDAKKGIIFPGLCCLKFFSGLIDTIQRILDNHSYYLQRAFYVWINSFLQLKRYLGILGKSALFAPN